MPAQTTMTRSEAFVQSFYNWYLNKQDLDTAIQRKPELFDPILLRALQDDATARFRAVGEIDGLDFDPSLNSQDPSTHFKVTGANGSLVRVIGYEKQMSQPRERLSVQVRCDAQHCVFVNFFYPASSGIGKTDLLTVLHLLHPQAKAAN